MGKSPIELTAVINISISYEESDIESESRAEILSKLLAEASLLQPAHQEMLIHFADCLHKADTREDKWHWKAR